MDEDTRNDRLPLTGGPPYQNGANASGCGRAGPLAFLEGFTGFTHADAYPGYDALFLPDDVIEVACWAHARRKFVEAETTDAALSKEAVRRIRELYAIERAARDLPLEERRALREREALPRLEALRAWLGGVEATVLPKSPMARAVSYTQAQWAALVRYVEDGRLEIDNNRAERALRPFAVGRKNWLFFQTGGGGRTAVVLMSLLMSAKAAGLDPRVYFRDVLLRIARESDPAKLVPLGWREHFAAEVAAERDAAIAKIGRLPADGAVRVQEARMGNRSSRRPDGLRKRSELSGRRTPAIRSCTSP